MALVHRKQDVQRQVPVAAGAVWPAWWPRMLDFDGENEWLRMEEFQDGDTLVVRAELPDMDVDKDVEITVGNGVVRIHGKREVKSEQRDKQSYRSEFRYGEFDREVAVPPEASATDVKATYSDGILEVRIPCPQPTAPAATKVPIAKK